MDFFKRVYRPFKIDGGKGRPATAKEYRTTCRHFRRFSQEVLALPECPIDRLDESLIEAFKGWRRAAPATINKDLRHLRALFKYRAKLAKTGQQLDLDFIRVATDAPEAWSEDELSAILKAARELPGFVLGIPAACWWNALLLVLYNTGLRITPVMLAPLSAFELETGTLRIAAETQKHKRGHVEVLHPSVAAAVRLIVDGFPTGTAGPRRFLFPWPFDRQGERKVPAWPSLNRRYKHILRAAGLSATRRDGFHKIRRTTATFICRAADPEAAQLQMGHSAPSVTRLYIDTSKLPARKTAADMLPFTHNIADSAAQLRLKFA